MTIERLRVVHTHNLPRLVSLGLALSFSALLMVVSGPSLGEASAMSVPAPVAAANWTTMANTENTAGATTQAGSVSCVTSVFCVAVTGFTGWGTGENYAELWNGTTWSPMTVGNVAGSANTALLGVSCVTTSFCIAVGQATGPKVVVEQWNGVAWSVVTTLIGEATQLYSVSCLSVTFCEAAGDTGGGTVGPPIAAQWNGSTWSAQAISLPANLTTGSLVSTSCTTPSFCMAVGFGYYMGSDRTPLAYSWNGFTWTETNSIANGVGFEPYSVSCAGLTFCAATALADPLNYVLIWNGSTWSAVQNLPGSGTLNGISCFSPTSCTAVGNTDGAQSEILTFDGQSWTQVANPPVGVAGSDRTRLFGVDCVTDWACVAAGASEFTPGFPNPNTYQPLFAMAPIARSGYYFVGSDGGIYSYGTAGSAPFLGSMGGTRLNSPIVGMATMPAGDGYYLVAADGGRLHLRQCPVRRIDGRKAPQQAHRRHRGDAGRRRLLAGGF